MKHWNKFFMGTLICRSAKRSLFSLPAMLLVLSAFLFAGLTIHTTPPPNMKKISDSDKFLDLEAISLFEYSVVMLYAAKKDGEKVARELAPDTSILEKQYGHPSKWDQEMSKMPVIGLTLQQIERYCDYRRMAVLEFNGMDVHFEVPLVEDLQPLQPKSPGTIKPITAVHKASKTNGFKGLFSNVPELCIGQETIYGAYPDGSLRPVPVDSTTWVGFRCIATYN
jgi:hypothetical protein